MLVLSVLSILDVCFKTDMLALFSVFIISLGSFVNGDCGVVSKTDWDGLEAVQVEYLPRPVELVIMQHTASPSCSTDAGCKELMRNIQTFHMENLNFWDIGSSFYVGGSGKVYEGSGWLHVGAHTIGYNRRSIGISFIGNFEDTEPTPQMLDAAKALIKCGVERGHLTSEFHVVAHRQLIATLSPGRKIYSKIRTWPEWLSDVSVLKK